LTRAAMDRAIRILKRYASTLRHSGVDHVEAVATSAARGARNGRTFVRRVRERTKIPLRVITGREEARLTYLGIYQAHNFRHPVSIVTFGGGSAQVICGSGFKMGYAASVPLGGARLKQMFFQNDPPLPEEVVALQRHVQRVWRPVVKEARRHRWAQAFGASATVGQVMLAARVRAGKRLPNAPEELSITQPQLKKLIDWLCHADARARIQEAELDPRREDLVLGVAIALQAWMTGCGIRTLRFTPGSIREGLVVDFLIRHYERRIRKVENPLMQLLAMQELDGMRLSVRRGRPVRVVRRLR